MKSARDLLIEHNKDIEAFEHALGEKFRRDLSHMADNPAAVFAAAAIILHVQTNFSPEDKGISVSYDTLFKLNGIDDKSTRKFFRDALGDDIGKFGELYFMFPDNVVKDCLVARGMNPIRSSG